MYVEQCCHIKLNTFEGLRFFDVPWDSGQLKRMNMIQRRVPSLLSECSVKYPHTHHFNLIRETT